MNDLTSILTNIDLLSVGIAASAIALIGFIVFLNDRTSVTAQSFFAFALLTIAWNLSNIIQYKFHTIPVTLFAMRLNLFIATWHAFTFFQLSFVFPEGKIGFPHWYMWGVVPLVIGTSILTLTPFVFSNIDSLAPVGEVTDPSRGLGIVLFSIVTIGLLFSGLLLLLQKARRAPDPNRKKHLHLVLFGMALTALLILSFSMFLPVFFGDLHFLPFSAFFLLPFIGLVSYTIYKHNLFNMKVVAVQMFTFVLGILTFLEILVTHDLITLLFRVSLLIAIVGVGVLLNRSVTKEVKLREEIEKLSAEKSEFMTFASHEIRNPVTAMRGYASLIMDGTTGEIGVQTKDSAERILVTGNDVLALIAQFLSKARIELGQISFQSDSFDAATAVSAVVDGYAPHAEQKGLTLIKHIPEQQHTIRADQGKLKEVVGNLIDNALKYTKAGTITVTVERHGVHIRIVIADTGVGIPAEVIPELFKKFSRADAQKVNLLGTGVGLYLAKTFIEGMGGRIWAESEGQGKGSRFIAEFPAA